jgi:hypothetical protein
MHSTATLCKLGHESTVSATRRTLGDALSLTRWVLKVQNVAAAADFAQVVPASSDSTNSWKQLYGSLRMANIFSYEKEIEACNGRLLKALRQHAATRKAVKLADIIAAYAYDVMFATTTGQAPSFLDTPADAARLYTAMRSWKFYSIIHGCYLRFHPFIDRLVKLVINHDRPANVLLRHLPDLDNVQSGIIGKLNKDAAHDHEQNTPELLTACIALVAAGSDAVVVHLLTTLFHIYRDDRLLERLRSEISQARIYQPPRLRYLSHCKGKLPLLHAVMRETLRLYQRETTGTSYKAPEGGVMIGDRYIPGGVSHARPSYAKPACSAWRFKSCRSVGVLSL